MFFNDFICLRFFYVNVIIMCFVNNVILFFVCMFYFDVVFDVILFIEIVWFWVVCIGFVLCKICWFIVFVVILKKFVFIIFVI